MVSLIVRTLQKPLQHGINYAILRLCTENKLLLLLLLRITSVVKTLLYSHDLHRLYILNIQDIPTLTNAVILLDESSNSKCKITSLRSKGIYRSPVNLFQQKQKKIQTQSLCVQVRLKRCATSNRRNARRSLVSMEAYVSRVGIGLFAIAQTQYSLVPHAAKRLQH